MRNQHKCVAMQVVAIPKCELVLQRALVYFPWQLFTSVSTALSIPGHQKQLRASDFILTIRMCPS